MRTLLFALAIPLLADSAAGLKWTAPDGWKSQGPRPMRAATYMIPPGSGDSESAECAIYFFGAGQGGSIEANLDRWKGQMLGPGGQPAEAKVEKRTVNGFSVTTIASAGEYTGMGGPMAASKSKQSGYHLLGAIVEGPGGNMFIKFTGPAKTIIANQPKFELLLKSFQKEK
jgi:hypothetical protein